MYRRRADGERGAVLPLIALVLTTLITFASFAIDLGYQRVVRRDMQALADVVALDLARRIDGVQPRSFYDSDPAWAASITQSRDRNLPTVNGKNITLVVQLGTTAPDGTFTESAPNEVPLAVKVTASADVDFFFQPRTGHATRSGVAIRQLNANAAAFGNFNVGSFLLSSDPSLATGVPILNRILGRALRGTDLGLDVLSYQGVADADIDLGRLATELGVGSADQLADAGVRNGRDVYLATARVLDAQGDTVAANAFRSIAASMDSNANIDLGDVFVEQGGSSGQVAAGTNDVIPGPAFLNSTAFAINGNNFIDVPGISLGIPGVTTTDLRLQVIQRPAYCAPQPQVRPVGCTAATSQVTLQLTNTLDIDLDAVLLGARLTGTLTTNVVAAPATGTLTAIRCPGVDPSPGIDVSVASGPITTTASEDLSLTATVTVLGLPVLAVPVLDVDVNGAVTSGTGAGGAATFAYPAEFQPSVGPYGTKRVGNPTLNLAAVLNASGTNAVRIGGVGVPVLATLVNTVNVGLAPTLAGIDTLVVSRLSRLLGLDIGGADVGAVDLRCFQGTSLVGEPPQVN